MKNPRSFLLITLGSAVLVITGAAFVNKMIHFAMTMEGNEIPGFGAAMLATYLLGILPIVFIMLWAVFTGRFRDVEGPKYRMLELQRELDRAAALRGGYHG